LFVLHQSEPDEAFAAVAEARAGRYRDLGVAGAVEGELDAERQRRSALAYDQQALLAKMIRLETEIILLRAETSHPD